MNDAAHCPLVGTRHDYRDIDNAGLVLLQPFLPRLFKQLGLLSTGDDGAESLRGENAARAVQLLQFLVDGRSDAPDAQLALNKLLCGVDSSFAAPPVVLSEAEQALCGQLLGAVIAHWSGLGNTTADTLRAVFLRREGRLQWCDGQPTMLVQHMQLDMLLQRLPWNIAVIRLPWMAHALQVQW